VLGLFLVKTHFPVQRYCGQEERQVTLRFQSEGLPTAFRKFSHSSKIWVFRPRSLTSHLPNPPYCPQGLPHVKTVLPTKKPKDFKQKGKVLKPKNIKDYASKKNDHRAR
jgi:hypothetical protein